MNDQFDDVAPLVDEVLAVSHERNSAQDELNALKLEVTHLRDHLSRTAVRASKLAFGEIDIAVRSQPVTVAAAIGLIGFVYGVTR